VPLQRPTYPYNLQLAARQPHFAANPYPLLENVRMLRDNEVQSITFPFHFLQGEKYEENTITNRSANPVKHV
jgi:hypothetical protein